MKKYKPFITAIFIGLIIRQFFIFVTTTGPSMAETLPENSFCLIDKAADIKLGDIVSFEEPTDDPLMVIKRVVAMEGDTIFIKDGEVYLKTKTKLNKPSVHLEDGIYYKNPFRKKMNFDKMPDFVKFNYNLKKTTIGKNEYFVLGDYRELAMDSRFYGVVKSDLMEGVVTRLF